MNEFMKLSIPFKPRGRHTRPASLYAVFWFFLCLCLHSKHFIPSPSSILPPSGKRKREGGPSIKDDHPSWDENFKRRMSGIPIRPLVLGYYLKKGKPRKEKNGANVLLVTVICSSGDKFEVKREIRE